STTLAAGTWLVPPTGVTATRTGASWNPVSGALIHQVGVDDATGDTILEMTEFDSTITTLNVPSLVALPASGTLTARVGGIAATLDVSNFSLETDEDSITGLAAQPVVIQ